MTEIVKLASGIHRLVTSFKPLQLQTMDTWSESINPGPTVAIGKSHGTTKLIQTYQKCRMIQAHMEWLMSMMKKSHAKDEHESQEPHLIIHEIDQS